VYILCWVMDCSREEFRSRNLFATNSPNMEKPFFFQIFTALNKRHASTTFLLFRCWCCLSKSTSTFLVKLIAPATCYGVSVLFSDRKENKGKLIFSHLFYVHTNVLTLKLHVAQNAILIILIFSYLHARKLGYNLPRISTTNEIFLTACRQSMENMLYCSAQQILEVLLFNYKGTVSIILLAVVDANYLFKYAHIGMQGRT
jgi:hypothetical protein